MPRLLTRSWTQTSTTVVAISLLATLTMQAAAACDHPRAPQSLPHGSTATKEQMTNAQQLVNSYSHEVQKVYLPCIEQEARQALAALDQESSGHAARKSAVKSSHARRHNLAVDELKRVAEVWGKEIQDFRGKAGSAQVSASPPPITKVASQLTEGWYPDGVLYKGKRLEPGRYYSSNQYFNCLDFSQGDVLGHPVPMFTNKCAETLEIYCNVHDLDAGVKRFWGVCGRLRSGESQYFQNLRGQVFQDRGDFFPCHHKRTSLTNSTCAHAYNAEVGMCVEEPGAITDPDYP